MKTLRIAWLVARPSRAGLVLSLLPVVAFTVTTALLVVVLGGAAALWTTGGQVVNAYRMFTSIALSLLVMPLLGLGGAAARLAARRRDDRLATLRLLGAPRGQVSAVAVLEAAVLALVGAALGAGVAHLLVPAIGAVRFAGAPLGGSMRLSGAATAGVVLAVTLVAVGSAVLGLRRVQLTPLGVRLRTDATRTGWVPAAVAVGVVAAASVGVQVVGGSGAVTVVVVGLGLSFAAGIGVLNLLGPFVIRLSAGRRLRRAGSAAALLAARRVLDDPKGAWRQVSGAAAVSFAAVVVGAGVSILDVASRESLSAEDAMLVTDIRTGLVVTVVGAFLMVACSVGVTQAAAILDRAELSRSLARLGTPESVVESARRRAVIRPLLVTTLGSAVTAAVVLFPLTGLALLARPLSLLTILGSVALGVALVQATLWATAPLQRRAMSETP
ncbi:permease [Phycicoccus sp. CSK15P-2]|uniref:FtsX-like permease family protein n=1 Tax=Phycicoccus sp. CSK15P-2 TaxID=2807627 RepID=UPI00194E6522|nr:FtsX-like permease family protein [Phycicoccus sp. CSK15P-2]MBM6404941.1 permease [Phycicoccus sp. CSK15P-2]